MIIVDTNVVSELMRPTPDRAVLAWLNSKPASDIWLSAVSVAELFYGVSRLPTGQRRSGLESAILDVVEIDFVGRILPFDLVAARYYGEVAAMWDRLGRPLAIADRMIASTAWAFGASGIATRNIRDFADLGLDLINPWDGA
jgi:toxin FitB